jgi:hypothetical protein
MEKKVQQDRQVKERGCDIRGKAMEVQEEEAGWKMEMNDKMTEKYKD